MCNWSQGIAEINFEKGAEKERIDNLKRMIKAGVIKDQILLCDYTEEEILEAEKDLCVNV